MICMYKPVCITMYHTYVNLQQEFERTETEGGREREGERGGAERSLGGRGHPSMYGTWYITRGLSSFNLLNT